jgi:hypothetical protein
LNIGDLLGDHALGVLDPLLSLARPGYFPHQLDRRWGEAAVGEQALERGAAPGKRALQQRFVVVGEQVEHDVHGGRLDR